MRKITAVLVTILFALVSCQVSQDEQAAPLATQIDSLCHAGRYQAALDSIRTLRARYPKAVNARRKALKLWQEASLKLTQADIARTDSALQRAIEAFNNAKNIRERNLIGIRKDSLQIRYEALCGTVRVIHKRQQELR